MMAKQDSLDLQTRDLVRFAAAIAQGYEPELRERVRLSGYPRCRSLGRGAVAPGLLMVRLPPRPHRFYGLAQGQRGARAGLRSGSGLSARTEWTKRGEEMCAIVYGENYRKLGTACARCIRRSMHG